MRKIVWIYMIFGLMLHANDVSKGMNSIKKRAYSQAVSYFQKACNEGNLKGCVKLGVCYQRAKGVKKDISKAVDYFQKACQNKEYEGCVRLALLYKSGKGIKKDIKYALELYRKSCDNNYASACFSLAKLHEEGKIVPQNPSIALSFFKKACEHNERISCMTLGDTYANVAGRDSVRRDTDKAMMYYKKGCAIEKTSVCNDIKFLLLQP